VQKSLHAKTILTKVAIVMASPPHLMPELPQAAPGTDDACFAEVPFIDGASSSDYHVFDVKTGEYWRLDGTVWTYVEKGPPSRNRDEH
jgi:hypothetical protein